MSYNKAIFITQVGHELQFENSPEFQFDRFETWSQHAYTILQAVFKVHPDDVNTAEFFRVFPHDSRVLIYIVRVLRKDVDFYVNFLEDSPKMHVRVHTCAKCSPPMFTYYVDVPRETPEGLENPADTSLKLLSIGDKATDPIPAHVLHSLRIKPFDMPVFAFQPKFI